MYSPALRFTIIFSLCFFVLINVALSQNFKLKVHIEDDKEAIMGASLLLNNKQIGISNSSGDYEGNATIGDTLRLEYPFYHIFTKILSDTSQQNIVLHSKEFRLNDVSISFNKRKMIDSVVKSAFSRLKYDGISKQVFLRQSITENNKKIILLNEGILELKYPPMDELLVPLEGVKKININVAFSCNLIPKAENRLIYKSNPQIKLRRGYIPDYFYKEIVTHISKESISSDSSNTVVSIYGSLPKFKIKTTYSYTIDSGTGNLKQIRYYEEEENKEDLLFISYNYDQNELISAYASTKQKRVGNHYSTNDELIIGKEISSFPLKSNFNTNKCGLENYVKGAPSCDVLNDYKKINSIRAQQYF